MMLKHELKKLFIKQFALILIIAAAVIKIFTSFSLFQPDYGSLTPQQQEIYLSYIDQLGGELTAEKEQIILEKYYELLSAQAKQKELTDKLNSGAYSTTEEYLQDAVQLPSVLGEEAAILKLYERYLSVCDNKDSSVLIASDAPVMTSGLEYVLLAVICYLSASAVHYERRMNTLLKTTPKGSSCTARAKLAVLFITVTAAGALFAVIELFALISEIGGENLFVSLRCVESFAHTEYGSLDVLGGFFCIHLTKLLGYLFTAAVTVFLAKLTGNLPLSIFSPLAVNIVWVYLLGNNTIAFYQPFSLMRGSAYFTGDHYIRAGNMSMLEYNGIPLHDLVILALIAAAVIVFVCVWYVITSRNACSKQNGKGRAATVASAVMLMTMLCGCSTAQDTAAYGKNAGRWTQNSDNCFYIHAVNDENGLVERFDIIMTDKGLNTEGERINRDIFLDGAVIDRICAAEDFLYYTVDDFDAGRYYLKRISLDDLTEEVMYCGDYSLFSTGGTKYLDMVTVWAEGTIDSYRIASFTVAGQRVFMVMNDGCVYSLDTQTGVRSYMFEDIEVNTLSYANGSIFYINASGELMRFNGEKSAVSDKVFSCSASEGQYFFAGNSDGVFCYDMSSDSITQISAEPAGHNMYADNGRVLVEKDSGGYLCIDAYTGSSVDIDNAELDSAYGNMYVMYRRELSPETNDITAHITDETTEPTEETPPVVDEFPNDTGRRYGYIPIAYINDEQTHLLMRKELGYSDENHNRQYEYVIYDATTQLLSQSVVSGAEGADVNWCDDTVTMTNRFIDNENISVYNSKMELIKKLDRQDGTAYFTYVPSIDAFLGRGATITYDQGGLYIFNSELSPEHLVFQHIDGDGNPWIIRYTIIDENQLACYICYQNVKDVFAIIDFDGNIICTYDFDTKGLGNCVYGVAGDYVYLAPCYQNGYTYEMPSGKILFYNTKTEEVKIITTVTKEESSILSVSPDGNYFVTASITDESTVGQEQDILMRAYDIESGEVVATFEEHVTRCISNVYAYTDRIYMFAGGYRHDYEFKYYQ